MEALGKNIAIVYFGRKGSGGNFAEILHSAALRNGDFPTMFTLDKLNLEKKISSGIRARDVFLNQLSSHRFDLVILPMSSPLDLGLGNHLRKRGVPTVRVIHDAKNHPGDLYPNNQIINYLVRDSDGIVCLSNYVASSLERKTITKIRVCPHPYYFSKVDSVGPLRKVQNRRLLCIGRDKPYKGIARFLEIWDQIGSNSNSLTIAGLRRKLPERARVAQFNGYMSDLRFHKMITEHDIVVLPYIEASQSGVIPLAHQYKRPVVVTPIGGLTEQVVHRKNGIISRTSENGPLIEATNEAIEVQWELPSVDITKSHDQLYHECLLAIF